MLSNKQLKYLKSLHLRKFRQKYGNFLAEGVKTVEEIIRHDHSIIEGVYATKDWIDANKGFVSECGNKVWEISSKELDAISLLNTPNKVLCVLKRVASQLLPDSLENDNALYLDEIKDPGNMGTILRIADWFGIKWVFCSDNCVEVYNPKVIQASMGAFLRVKTKTVSLNELVKTYPGCFPFGSKPRWKFYI